MVKKDMNLYRGKRNEMRISCLSHQIEFL
uniref:Uncharacterized protein n=1 Tax=Rhizophora mucronata TaxID=61149 RepID=A0A2P2PHN7_RHIMU